MILKGQVQNREPFLANVANKLGRERRTEKVIKPTWKHKPQWDVLNGASQEDLVEVLKKQCEVIHTRVFESKASELSKQINLILKQDGAESIITWKDDRFSEYNLEDSLSVEWPEQGISVHEWDTTRGYENIVFAEQADVGITFSDMTLAESGTVVLFSHADKGRSVSLLPKTYIAIIPKSSLVPRMTQATAYISNQVREGKLVPSCVNFITGPSNSADIELNLVVGVHGPIRATYIIVEDK